MNDIKRVFINEIKKFGIKKASALSGLPYTTIYAWVIGASEPPLVKAQKVADAMNLEFLLFDKF